RGGRGGGGGAAGQPPGRHRAADAGHHDRHRGLGARAARAVALDASPVEDAAARGRSRARGRGQDRGGRPLSAPPGRILVRAPNWIGDVVLSLAAVRDLRRRNFPQARIEGLARPWVADLYRAVAEVDAVRTSTRLAADARALRGAFDAAVLLPNSFAAALPACLARIPRRWRY